MNRQRMFALGALPLFLATTACMCTGLGQGFQRAQDLFEAGSTLQSGYQELTTNLPPGFEKTLQAAPGALATVGADPTLQAAAQAGLVQLQTAQADPTLKAALATGLEQLQELAPTLESLGNNATMQAGLATAQAGLGSLLQDGAASWENFPKPSDATVQAQTKGALVLQTGQNLAGVADFYRAALGNLGYTENLEARVQQEQVLSLTFNSTDGSQLIVSGQANPAGGSSVSITRP